MLNAVALYACASPEIVERVRASELPPFRPKLPERISQNDAMTSLMKDCWSEDAAMRPPFNVIRNRLTSGNNKQLLSTK